MTAIGAPLPLARLSAKGGLPPPVEPLAVRRDYRPPPIPSQRLKPTLKSNSWLRQRKVGSVGSGRFARSFYTC
jgi:hypothetical protein